MIFPALRKGIAMGGRTNYEAGCAAEGAVARRYEQAGHRIADRRWRGHGAEIDLIAEDGDGFIFVEVKKSVSFARAAERLTRAQMERIYRAASGYISRSPLGQLANVRFDVALVDSSGQIEIVENAFGH